MEQPKPVKEKSYTSMSIWSSVRVDVLGIFFPRRFLLVPPTSLTISKEYFLVNASGERGMEPMNHNRRYLIADFIFNNIGNFRNPKGIAHLITTGLIL